MPITDYLTDTSAAVVVAPSLWVRIKSFFLKRKDTIEGHRVYGMK